MKSPLNHIVFLTPGFPENEADTTCIPALQLFAKQLQEHPNYKVSVVAFHYPKKKSSFSWNGITVYSLGSSNFITKILLWRKAYKTLKQIHLKEPITVLHSFWLGECALIGHWFSKNRQLKHLTTLMGQDALKGNGYAKILPLKKLRLVTLSKFHHDTFWANYKTETEIIPWGINPADCTFSSEKNIDIIAVGSLIPLKDYDLFLEIISELNSEKPIKVVIIGDGVLRESLQKKIKSLQLENVVALKGLLNYKETMSYIAKSKILLHTSNYESFGLVFAEALQCKTLIVSKAVGCFSPSKNWKTGSSKAELIEACRYFLNNNFNETEQNPFTIDKTVNAYNAIYHE